MHSKFRVLVLAGLVVAQLATVLALVMVSGRMTGAAEVEHTNALLQTAAVETTERIRSHIESVQSVVAVTATVASEQGFVGPDLESGLLASLDRTPQLAGAFIGLPDGSFTDVRRVDDRIRIKHIEAVPQRVVTIHSILENGETVDEAADPTDAYDPRLRPWYSQALADPGELTWTDPYVFFTSGQIGVTVAQAVEKNGEIFAVVGADIELGSLSAFLSELRISDDGGIVVFDGNGSVLAHTNPSLVQVETTDGFGTVSIADLEDPVARAAVASYVGRGPGEATDVHSVELASEEMIRASFRSVELSNATWTAAVFVDDTSLVPGLASARSQERLLIVAVGLLSVFIVGVLGMVVSRPIGELELRARTDALTGLANRRSALENADRVAEAEGCRGVAMIDLDYFKLINDTYGHQVGDEVLRMAAQRIEAAVRADETSVGRIGGEEFLVVFNATDPEAAEAACRRIQTAIRRTPFGTAAGQIELTASIGLATTSRPATTAELLSRADAALLEAKHSGRDQTVVESAILELS